MKICVISPKVSSVSANKLAKALGADYSNPFHEDRRDYSQYDLVFNYGCNRDIRAKKLINKTKQVATCIDKIRTYDALIRDDVPTVNYVTQAKLVPDEWEIIVLRKDNKAAKGDGLDYAYKGEKIPEGMECYSEYYKHKHEFRIVVFQHEVIGRYVKIDKAGETQFIEVEAEGFKAIDDAAVKASKSIGIDYVGFDVLAKSQKKFIILEANSGPILTDEVSQAIKEKLIGR